jgi:hypothetical protein
MNKEKQAWFDGPFPWLVSTIAFLLPSINYFIQGDITGGSIFSFQQLCFSLIS